MCWSMKNLMPSRLGVTGSLSDFSYIGTSALKLESVPEFAPFTGVMLLYDEENAYFSGDKSGRVLETSCPWATQEMADNMLASIKGYAYQPYEAVGAVLDPAAELGDAVRVGGVTGLLASAYTTFDALCASDISAPSDEEVVTEYGPFDSPIARELKRKVTLGRDYFGAKISKGKGIEITKTSTDGTQKSRAIFNSDVFAMYNDDGAEALYFDSNEGKFKFRGDVDITGGTMNINNNFIVDAKGNVTLSGNINLSAGEITWGENDPSPDVRDILDRRYGITYTTIGKVEIESPLIRGEEMQVSGSFQCLDEETGEITGHMGAAHGLDASGHTTSGVALARTYSSVNGLGSNYVIVTDGGVRMQCGSNSLTVTDTGAYFNGKYIATVE